MVHLFAPRAVHYGPEERPQIVISDSRVKELQIVHCNEMADFNEGSRELLKKIQGSQDKELFSIIVKQKQKISELKMRNSMKMLPVAIMNHVNFLAKSVDAKEVRIQELAEISRKEKAEIQELKRSKTA